MNDVKLFFGRSDELKRWGEVLASSDGQAVVVVGQQGMGKTMLVEKMAQLAGDHPEWTGAAVYYQITSTDHPDNTMTLMMDHALEAAQVEAGSFDPTPERRRQWKALIKAIVPKGGDLVELVNSLRYDRQKHIRDQFIQRLELISRRMAENGRAVFVLDPDKYMPEESADTWRLVVRKLPEKIKLVFAQRNDGRLMASSDFLALCNVVRIPEGNLEVLEERAVEEMIEVFQPRIPYGAPEVRRAIGAYNRHPYAVPAALDMLANKVPIEDLPSDPTPEGIAAAQWKKVGQKGTEAVRLFRAHAILEVPVPSDVVLAVAEIESETLEALLANDYLRGLLRSTPDGRQIYHSLLAEHVLRSIPARDAQRLHGRAVEVYRNRLKAKVKPDLLSATRLAEHVLAAEGEKAFGKSFVDECTAPLILLGSLGTCELLSERALKMVETGSIEQAMLLGNLGVIYKTRGDLDGAEKMLRKALKINEKLDRLEGMAAAYGNLGLIYLRRGDLDGAEEMLRKALKIHEKLGSLEGMAAAYGNLGLIYRTRGDLDGAEEMHRKALKIDEKLGSLEGMANQYGNLGVIYQTRGTLDRAEEMLRKALKIHEKLGSLEGMAAAYGNLGVLYQIRGDLEGAENMHRKALEIHEKLGCLEGIAIQYGNLGLIYRRRGDLDGAEKMHRKSLEIEKKLGRLEGMASDYGNLGLIYRTRGDLDGAEKMQRKALEINEKLGCLEGMASQYGNLGVIARERGELAQARQLWEKSRDLFRKVGMTPDVEQVDRSLEELAQEERR